MLVQHNTRESYELGQSIKIPYCFRNNNQNLGKLLLILINIIKTKAKNDFYLKIESSTDRRV